MKPRRTLPTVLQIVPALDAGGAERTTIDIAKALIRAGFRSLVVSEGGRLEGELAAAGAELIRLPVASKNPLRLLANADRLAAVLCQEGVGIVHARSRAPALSALLAARRTGTPFVTTYHGIYNAQGALKRFYNSVMARGDTVIANSQWTAEHVRATYPWAAERIVVIPRGIDLQCFNPLNVAQERVRLLKTRWQVADTQRLILMPGRLTRWKGQLVLVEALRRMKEERRLPPEVRAVLAGDAQGRDAYRDALTATIASAGLGDVVIIAGHVADMPAAYLAADIVVSASTDPEAFGRVAPEAQAMGRPVIATDHGGARETILPRQSGLLVPPGEPGALADALLDLLRRPHAERTEMGRRGQAHIASRFSLEKMCADTLLVYRTLLDSARRHRSPQPSR